MHFKKVFAGRRRHTKNCLQREPLIKKMFACENFPTPHSRQKDNGPSVISSVPFGNATNFIYRLALLYMMAKTLVKKSQ